MLKKKNCFGVVILFHNTLIHEIVAKKSMVKGKDNRVLICNKFLWHPFGEIVMNEWVSILLL